MMVPIRQIFVQIEVLNSNLETLPCFYYSPKANPTTKQVLHLDDVDLKTHLLHMCPAKWQTYYDLAKNTTPVITRALLLVQKLLKIILRQMLSPSEINSKKGQMGNERWNLLITKTPKRQKSGLD